MQFNLKQMTPSLIVKHLRHILDAEQIPADLAALNLLAHSASGSMRDALSLLDQAIAHGGGKVIETQVCDMLGLVDLDYLFLILEALLDNNIAKMLDIVDDMAVRSLSFDSALQELASLLTRIQVAQLAPEAVADDLPEKTRLLLLAEKFDAEFIQLAYQIAIHSRKELSLAPDEQAGFIMTLLRLHTFLPVLPHTVSARDQVCAPLAAANTSVQTAPATEASRPIDIMPDHSRVSYTPIAATTPPQGDKTKLFLNLPDWSDILDTLALTGIVKELGQQCELLEIGEKEVKLRLDPTYRHLQIKSSQDKLKQVLSEHFGRPLALSITVEEVLKEVPATRAQRNKQERQEKILALIEQDEFIQEAISLFNATVIPSSIKPV
jgi:DNA polymerase-3 subunit gamma/tau